METHPLTTQNKLEVISMSFVFAALIGGSVGLLIAIWGLWQGWFWNLIVAFAEWTEKRNHK